MKGSPEKTQEQDYIPIEIQELKQWMKSSGFIVHPSIEIPKYFDGVQGVGTKQSLPHKTVIIGVPSDKIITVKRCYDDPELKGLFRSNDEFFDYEVDEEAQFKILCVFLMYHKIHIEKSPWRAYLNTIAAPETAVDWSDKQLIGLNKSLIQQILHVRRECNKVEKELCSFLKKTKQFKELQLSQIEELFRVCYKSVLTRCFGYYFSTACLIPVADLMNHHCESIDHQLIHVDYECDRGFHESYRPKKNKLNCELLGVQKPNRQLELPFQLKHLVREGLAQKQLQQLSQLKVKDINNKVYQHLQEKLENISDKSKIELEKLDFCELDDEQDNDTEEETQYEQMKTMQNIKKQEVDMMEEFKKHYVKVEKYEDVEKRVYNDFPEEKKADEEINEVQKKKQELKKKEYEEAEGCEDPSEKCNSPVKIQAQETTLTGQSSQPKSENTGSTNEKQENQSHLNPLDQCPVQIIPSSSSSESGSEEQQWCLQPSCYFTMSTSSPVSAGEQLYNSYGSRTNKFLLVWYGFAYRDNLYDSVTLRMQALFTWPLPAAKEIVLDSYIGGQGLCFRKNEHEEVRPEQVSKQFRLKRSSLSKQLIMYLRLYLLNYYKGSDLYKIFITFPSSLDFELMVLRYYKDVVESIYSRYPVEMIKYLKEEEEKQKDLGKKKRTQFKIIYLQEQRKILDINLDAVETAIQIVNRIREQKLSSKSTQFDPSIFMEVKVPTLRILKEYFIQLQNNYSYICYTQSLPKIPTKNQSESISEPKSMKEEKTEENEDEGEWEDIEGEEMHE